MSRRWPPPILTVALTLMAAWIVVLIVMAVKY